MNQKRDRYSLVLQSALVLIGIISAALTPQPARTQAQAPIPSQPGRIRAFDLLPSAGGWLLIDQGLFWTEDQGDSWVEITPPGSAVLWAVDFVDRQHGFAVISTAPPDVSSAPLFQLASTQDGGHTWTTANLPAEPFTGLPELLPERVNLIFSDPLNGRVFLKQPTSSNFTLYTGYGTGDGGAAWQKLEGDSAPPAPPGPLVDPGLSMPLTTGQVVQLSRPAASPGQADPGSSDLQPPPASAWALVESGACPSKQNCRQTQSLLSTTDGGETWHAVSLPASAATTPAAPQQQVSGQAFDKCEIPTLDQLQEWWNQSPYSAVNLYIGGIMRACANKALTPSFLSSLDRQGWTLIPTWVGPQASCSGFKYVMSADPNTAYQQGIAEADAAASAALALKLWGQVIYYDLESFPPNDQGCLEAARAFMNGWTLRIQEWGFISGVYGSPCSSGLASFLTVPNPPQATWIALWLTPAAYNPDATVWTEVCGFSNSFWPNHQRIRQYAGGHPETWGSVTLMIDSNVMDGYVAQAFGQPGQVCPRPQAPARAGVILYTAADYDCYARQAGFGYVWRDRSGFQNLSSFFDERASSIYVPPGWSAMLYENRDRGGGKICVNAPGDADFDGKTFDNGHKLDSMVSSFEVFAGKNCTESAAQNPPADTQPPDVNITSHVNGGMIVPASGVVAIQAALSDNGNGISHAQFFAGADSGAGWTWQSLGYDYDGSNGWSASWTPGNLVSITDLGLYVFAWDQAGNGIGKPVLHLSIADGQAPMSQIQPLPATLDSTIVQVEWGASDNLSAIDHYDLQVQDNGGAWVNWLTNVPPDQVSAIYYGQLGHSYGFRSRAADLAGNQSPYPASAETSTLVNPCTGDTFEANDSLASAKPLPNDQVQAHSICGVADQDWLVFGVTAGQAYQFTTHNLGTQTDTFLGLYNAAGSLLAASDDISSDLSSRLYYQALTNGTVYLKIHHTDPRVAGSAITYSVSASQAALLHLPLIGKP